MTATYHTPLFYNKNLNYNNRLYAATAENDLPCAVALKVLIVFLQITQEYRYEIYTAFGYSYLTVLSSMFIKPFLV